MNISFKKLVSILITTLVVFSLIACTDKKTTNVEDTTKGIKVGIVTGTVFDLVLKNDDPNVVVEYYNLTSDLPIALNNHKIDAYAVDEPVGRILCNKYNNHYIDRKVSVENYGIAISKENNDLNNKFNGFISDLKNSGYLQKLQDIWLGDDESKKVIDYDSIANNSNILRLVTSSNMEPFDYIKDGKFAGYEIALVAQFCKEYGYGLQIIDTDFSGIVSMLSTGKADLGTSVITITDERKQTMNFTGTIYEGGMVLVKEKSSSDESNLYEQLRGTSIGVQRGAAYDEYVLDLIPDSEVQYYNVVSDMKMALDSNKIKGFAIDGPVASLFINENNNEYKELCSLKDLNYGFALSKSNPNSEELVNKLSDFLITLKQNGTIDEVYDLWTSTDEDRKKIDLSDLTGENGEVKLDVSSETGAPFIYKVGDNLVGLEIDLIHRFCKEYGYSLNITDLNIDGLLTSIAVGKCDIGAAGISITEERKESMYFADEQISSKCVVVVKSNEGIIENESNTLFDSFYKTFIKEERWKLFVSGILTTILITALSIVIGTALGFLAYLVYRNMSNAGKTIVDFISNIIQKTPAVVILMIIYYVIFGKIEISGRIVSIIGLSILFANSVMGLIKMGDNTIDKGQMEAATTLGYSKFKAFIEIIMPQIIINVVSGYKSAVITLIKESAIVGYIAVQDITKVGDIIRSRTYEAFFPLISIAIIYYLIATIFILLLGRFEIKIDPKKRKSIPVLKGVKINDKG